MYRSGDGFRGLDLFMSCNWEGRFCSERLMFKDLGCQSVRESNWHRMLIVAMGSQGLQGLGYFPL